MIVNMKFLAIVSPPSIYQSDIAYCISTVKIRRMSDQYYFNFNICEMEHKSYIMCYYPLTYDDRLILDMFYIKLLCIIIISQISNQ